MLSVCFWNPLKTNLLLKICGIICKSLNIAYCWLFNIAYNCRLVQYLGDNIKFDSCVPYVGNSKDER